MSNCGLPDGVIHQHVERCYRAGVNDGAAAFREANRESIEALIDFASLAVPALRALGIESDDGEITLFDYLDSDQLGRLLQYIKDYQ